MAQTFLPVGPYRDLFNMPDVIELPEDLNGVSITPPTFIATPSPSVQLEVRVEDELVVGIPGLDAVTLVIGSGGEVANLPVLFEATADPTVTVTGPLSLRLAQDLFVPARRVPGGGPEDWERDPDNGFVQVPLGDVEVTSDLEGNLGVQTVGSVSLPPTMIGDSGIVVEAADVELFLNATEPPPGRPAGEASGSDRPRSTSPVGWPRRPGRSPWKTRSSATAGSRAR